MSGPSPGSSSSAAGADAATLQRRLDVLTAAVGIFGAARDEAHLRQEWLHLLGDTAGEFAFVLVYRVTGPESAALWAAFGCAPGDAIAPRQLTRSDATSVWPWPSNENEGTRWLADLPRSLPESARAGGGAAASGALVLPLQIGAKPGEVLGLVIVGMTSSSAPTTATVSWIEALVRSLGNAIARNPQPTSGVPGPYWPRSSDSLPPLPLTLGAVERQWQFHEAVLEQVSDAVIACDHDGGVTYLNDAAARNYGVAVEQVIGRPLTELFDQRWLRPQDEHAAAEAIAAGQTWRGESLHVRRDGTLLLVESVVHSFTDSAGRKTGTVAVVRDISARRDAEKALRQSEERLRLATRAGGVGVWDWDILTDELTWTDHVYELHGYKPGAFAPTIERFRQLVHPQDRDELWRVVEQTLQTGGSYELEFRAIWPDGSVRWLATASNLVRDGERPVRMIGATIDITERKHIELALRESEERFRTLASHAPVGIFLSDQQGDCVYVNERWCEMAGMSHEEALGQGWVMALHPEDRG
ncbi:MAG TPA: PAS domain S-box protein, partial [Candidatus Synoicihabitans sp.]|nr:PAS domain S-box protein [Candidatus Synoicihabitans sp.]